MVRERKCEKEWRNLGGHGEEKKTSSEEEEEKEKKS